MCIPYIGIGRCKTKIYDVQNRGSVHHKRRRDLRGIICPFPAVYARLSLFRNTTLFMEQDIIQSGAFWQYLPAIITAIGTILMGWWKYDQTRRDARVKLEMAQKEADLKAQSKRRNDNVSQIYGHLWQLLHNLHADRVYIIQPHPLDTNEFLSIGLEVLRTGVTAMKQHIQRLPMADVAAFSAELSSRDFIYYRTIEENVRDKRARALLLNGGSSSAIIRRLTTAEDGWVGNIFCEFNHTTEITPEYAKGHLENAAEHIQYILPPIQ